MKCKELEIEIIAMESDKDHSHMFLNCLPILSPSDLMQQIKGYNYQFKFHITFLSYSFWTYRPSILLPKNIAHCPNPKEKQPRCDLCMDIHSAKPYPTWKFPNIFISSSSLPLFNIIFPFYFSTTAKRCQTQKIDIASDDGQAMDAKTAEAVDALMLSLSECSEVEEGIVSMLNDNQQLAVVSFTEAPLLWEDDHYDRVKAADITEYYKDNDNNRSKKGEFTLFTAVFRSSELDSNGKHKYTTRTYGAWNKNSAVGGENYPDSGVDYVLQSAPSTWFRTQDDWMSAEYYKD